MLVCTVITYFYWYYGYYCLLYVVMQAMLAIKPPHHREFFRTSVLCLLPGACRTLSLVRSAPALSTSELAHARHSVRCSDVESPVSARSGGWCSVQRTAVLLPLPPADACQCPSVCEPPLLVLPLLDLSGAK